MVVEVLEKGRVIRGSGGLDKGGSKSARGDKAEEGGEGKFGFEMEEYEEDKIGVARFYGFVEGDGIFFHGEQKGDLFTCTGLVIEELSGEMCAAFVISSTSNSLKRDSTFILELVYNCGADGVFVGGGATDFGGGPMDVNFVSRESEIFRQADTEEVFLPIDESLNEFGWSEADVLLVRQREADPIVPNGIENSKGLTHVDELIAVVEI